LPLAFDGTTCHAAQIVAVDRHLSQVHISRTSPGPHDLGYRYGRWLAVGRVESPGEKGGADVADVDEDQRALSLGKRVCRLIGGLRDGRVARSRP